MYAVDHPVMIEAARPVLRRPVLARTRAVAQRVLAAIAAGSDDPIWRTLDAHDRAALLPRSQYDRLLSEGCVPARR
jgi:hypothetical protein